MRAKKTPEAAWATLRLDSKNPSGQSPRSTLDYFPGFTPDQVAGIDEAGRGAFAGPVVAAAVILPKKYSLPGLGDSKTLSAAMRDTLSIAIGEQAVAWGLGYAWPREIDSVNILQATLKAMARAVCAMRLAPAALLIDGDKLIPPAYLALRGSRPEYAQRCVVDADALIPAVSAASVLAKSYRDHLMEKFDTRYPGYGFAAHKGYGTAQHRSALAQFGPSPIHRLSFHGVLPEPAPQQQQGTLC